MDEKFYMNDHSQSCLESLLSEWEEKQEREFGIFLQLTTRIVQAEVRQIRCTWTQEMAKDLVIIDHMGLLR